MASPANLQTISGTIGADTSSPSDYIYLNSQYGTLNPLFDTKLRENLSGMGIGPLAQTDFFGQTRAIIGSQLVPDLYKESGPYIGVVLRIECTPDYTNANALTKNWIQRAELQNGRSQADITPMLTLRVRIPELHVHLPVPKTLPESDTSLQSVPNAVYGESTKVIPDDNQIIKMYPLFSSMDSSVASLTPQLGSLVWVDFVDRGAGQIAGIYLKPVNYEKMTINSAYNQQNPKASFLGGGAGSVPTLPADGNYIGGGSPFVYEGGDLPPGTPANVGAVRNKIPSFVSYRGTVIANDPVRIQAAQYIFDRMTLALGWSASWAAAAIVQAGGESGLNPNAREHKNNPYPTYGPGFGLFQITNNTGMGAAMKLSAIKKGCASLPDDIKQQIGYTDGATILPDIDDNGNIVARDVSYLEGLEAGDGRMAADNPPPPLRTGKKVAGYYNALDPRITMDRWALTVLRFEGLRNAAYNQGYTAAQAFDKLHWSYLGAGYKSAYIKKANKGDQKALQRLKTFSAGNAKRQRNGHKWLGEQLWGPIGVYADKSNPIVLSPGQELNVGSQVPVVTQNNYPTITSKGGNFYSTNGGFLLPEKNTIAGILKQKVDKNGNLISYPTKIIRQSVPTNVQLLENIPIKPDNWDANRDLKSLRRNSVRVYSYGEISDFAENLVSVPSVLNGKKQKLHILAAKRIESLNFAWLKFLDNSVITKHELSSNNITGIFRVSRGWKKHKYRNDYDYYLQKIESSMQVNSPIDDFHSPFETGLVFEFGNNGMQSNNDNFYDLLSWNWLLENAYLFGIYPSDIGPYVWEVQVPRENWFNGKEFVSSKSGMIKDGIRYNYGVYVLEESIETGRKTSDKKFISEQFK